MKTKVLVFFVVVLMVASVGTVSAVSMRPSDVSTMMGLPVTVEFSGLNSSVLYILHEFDVLVSDFFCDDSGNARVVITPSEYGTVVYHLYAKLNDTLVLVFTFDIANMDIMSYIVPAMILLIPFSLVQTLLRGSLWDFGSGGSSSSSSSLPRRRCDECGERDYEADMTEYDGHSWCVSCAKKNMRSIECGGCGDAYMYYLMEEFVIDGEEVMLCGACKFEYEEAQRRDAELNQAKALDSLVSKFTGDTMDVSRLFVEPRGNACLYCGYKVSVVQKKCPNCGGVR